VSIRPIFSFTDQGPPITNQVLMMHLIIDGYNLLHVTRSLMRLNSVALQRERDRLAHQLSIYQQFKPCEITVVFDGWQGGWNTEKRERKKGIELIFTKLGVKADEVIKRLVREEGSKAIVITTDREITRYAERMAVAVISSEKFQERIEISDYHAGEAFKPENNDADEGGGHKRKGPSRRLSKREKRMRTMLKKL
jgi:predicted RNA-binding protein with PIN domain